jgi:uncharacterized protein
VVEVRRSGAKVLVTDASGSVDSFDHVILACHSDQSLAMLADANPAERALLAAVRYRPNEVYLHGDPRLMPRRKAAWAAWNFLKDSRAGDRQDATVTYWMNRLQNIDPSRPLFVTLNPQVAPRDDLTFARFVYDHPQFDRAAFAAQSRLAEAQGGNRVWFAGAWTGHGFHEDGCRSGFAVAQALGAALPWESEARPRLRVAQ